MGHWSGDPKCVKADQREVASTESKANLAVVRSHRDHGQSYAAAAAEIEDVPRVFETANVATKQIRSIEDGPSMTAVQPHSTEDSDPPEDRRRCQCQCGCRDKTGNSRQYSCWWCRRRMGPNCGCYYASDGIRHTCWWYPPPRWWVRETQARIDHCNIEKSACRRRTMATDNSAAVDQPRALESAAGRVRRNASGECVSHVQRGWLPASRCRDMSGSLPDVVLCQAPGHMHGVRSEAILHGM